MKEISKFEKFHGFIEDMDDEVFNLYENYESGMKKWKYAFGYYYENGKGDVFMNTLVKNIDTKFSNNQRFLSTLINTVDSIKKDPVLHNTNIAAGGNSMLKPKGIDVFKNISNNPNYYDEKAILSMKKNNIVITDKILKDLNIPKKYSQTQTQVQSNKNAQTQVQRNKKVQESNKVLRFENFNNSFDSFDSFEMNEGFFDGDYKTLLKKWKDAFGYYYENGKGDMFMKTLISGFADKYASNKKFISTVLNVYDNVHKMTTGSMGVGGNSIKTNFPKMDVVASNLNKNKNFYDDKAIEIIKKNKIEVSDEMKKSFDLNFNNAQTQPVKKTQTQVQSNKKVQESNSVLRFNDFHI